MRGTFFVLILFAQTLFAASDSAPPLKPKPTTLDVAQLFIDDMSLANAILPTGTDGDWAKKPRVGSGNILPAGWNHAIMWGQIYVGRPGNPAQNVRVQIRDCALWMLSRKDKAWKLLKHGVTPEGAAYREDFKDDANTRADVRTEADGSIAVKLMAGYNYHFWPKDGRVPVDPADIAGLAACFFARLVVDDPTKPDDRDQARLLGSCGGDYWRSKEAQWKSDWSNNNDWAIGRFKLLTRNWQPVTSCTFSAEPRPQLGAQNIKTPQPSPGERTLSAEILRKNPPPIRSLEMARNKERDNFR